MYRPSQTNASTLPRATTTTLAKHSAASSSTHYRHTTDQNLFIEHQLLSTKATTELPPSSTSTSKTLSQNLLYNNDNDNIDKVKRPTYGAYTNNTLPRGPYLQYKFNDQQSIYSTKKLLQNDNNNQKDRQIERLKGEFITNLSAQQPFSIDSSQSHISNNTKRNIYLSSNHINSNNETTNLHSYLDGVQTLGRRRIQQEQNHFISNHNNYSNQLQTQKPDTTYNHHHYYTAHQNNANLMYRSNSNNAINHHSSTSAHVPVNTYNNEINKNPNRILDNRNTIVTPTTKYNRINYENNVQYNGLFNRNNIAPPHTSFTTTRTNNIDNIPTKDYYHQQHQKSHHQLQQPDRHLQNNELPLPDIKPITSSVPLSSAPPPSLSSRFTQTNFLKQIHSKNVKMANNLNDFQRNVTTQIYSGEYRSLPPVTLTTGNCDDGNSMNTNNIDDYYNCFASNKIRDNRINFVTLADVIHVKVNGLNQTEGWALLCQSIQALQDLFLADTPSISRILPLVNPQSLQITSRGRVVFNVMPTSQIDACNNVGIYLDTLSFLSPEFLNSIGTKQMFSESDIEKMWIYSLGITLQKMIHTSSIQTIENSQLSRSYNHHPSIIPSMLSHTQPPPPPPQQNRTPTNRLRQLNGKNVDDNEHNNDAISSTIIMASDEINSLKVLSSSSYCDGLLLSKHNKHLHKYVKNDNNSSDDSAGKQFVEFNNIAEEAVSDYENDRTNVLTSLEYVISCMCTQNLHNRASLMYLLDIISEYCRCYHQVKPFSHIAMDLFKEVIDGIPSETSHHHTVKPKFLQEIHKRKLSEDHSRSDTDSGRSSAHGDKELFKESQSKPSDFKPPSSGALKVIRRTVQSNNEVDANQYKYSTIGYVGKKCIAKRTASVADSVVTRVPIVIRKKNEILRKRRSTIAVNSIDVKMANKELVRGQHPVLFAVKSVNSIDKIDKDIPIHKSSPCRNSMPDLSDVNKFSTLPNLKVRRNRVLSSERLYISTENIDDTPVVKSSGPEFIANSSAESHYIEMTDIKCQHRRTVSVLLLNGHSIKIACNSTTTTAHQIFETVIKLENLAENFFLGLCALIGGDFVFLPSDLKIYKVAPQIWSSPSKKNAYSENVLFTLFLRIKFFLPTLRGISSLESRHLLYLQLRKSILESQILCNDDDLIALGGFALQAEIGDFQPKMKITDYFTLSHYLPEGVYQKNNEMSTYLRNSHYSKNGLHPKEAEQNFIRYVQEMKEYGLHLYSAIWTIDDQISYDVYIGISLRGIIIFQRSAKVRNSRNMELNRNSKTSYHRKLYVNFDWLEIENLCYSKHILCIVVRKSESLKAKDNNRIKYKFKMDGRKSYFAFNLASEHHKFYMKLRNSFISLKTLSDELNIPIISTASLLNDKSKIAIIVPADYDQEEPNQHDGKVSAASTSSSSISTANNFIKGQTIKQPVRASNKTVASHVKNLKKSMLNDNKLLKLRNKFLKRSKSSPAMKKENKIACNNDDDRARSTEENQNKENECPKLFQHHDNNAPIVMLSPNRNRVKMGTRVFSAQFLNKSFENIYAAGERLIDDCEPNDEQHREMAIDDGPIDDGLSLKSTSLSSLYFSEKMSEKYSDSPLPSEAYVIHSSIKSGCGTNYFTLPNDETVSDSLLDKFNNISTNQPISDRIITKITIIKEIPPSMDKQPIILPNKINSNLSPSTINNSKWIKENLLSPSTATNSSLMEKLYLSRSQESIFTQNTNKLTVKCSSAINQNNSLEDEEEKQQQQQKMCIENGYTLGISIVQGSDQHVYVKDLVNNGPGERSGIQIGDQILAVNGISLLNLSYNESLNILQKTGKVVELIVSQIYQTTSSSTPPPPPLPPTLPPSQSPSTQLQSIKSLPPLNRPFPTKSTSYANIPTVTNSMVDNITNKCSATSKCIEIEYDNNGNKNECNSTANNMNMYRHQKPVHEWIDNANSCADIKLQQLNAADKYFKQQQLVQQQQQHQEHRSKQTEINRHNEYKNFVDVGCERDSSVGYRIKNGDISLVSARSMPDLPKVVATIPKQIVPKSAYPRNMGLSRKYVGPVKYPVTPIRATIGLETSQQSLTQHQHQQLTPRLSLLADDDDEQVFI